MTVIPHGRPRGPDGPYSTAFPLTENPINESGVWHRTSPGQTNVRTELLSSVHVAHGTQVSGLFDDSQAYLKGFSVDHTVEAVIWKGTVTSSFSEVELLLRWSDGNPVYDPGGGFGTTDCYGYEINLAHDGSYVQLGHFKGPLLAQGSLGAAPVTGDVFKASIQTSGANAIISAWFNNVLITNFPYTDTSPFLHGNPGIGFFVSDTNNNQYGFSSVTARNS